MRQRPFSAVWLLVALLLAACASPAPVPTATPPQTPPTRDVTYTRSLAPAVLPQSLDVYAPAGESSRGGWPVVVVIHGFMQSKRDFRLLSEEMATQGALVFTLDWPTYSGSSVLREHGKKMREMTETLVCAVRYASAHAADYGGNPERLILVGFSLGAYGGALVSLAGETLEVEWAELSRRAGEPADQVECLAAGDTRVAAFIGIAGPYQAFDDPQTAGPELAALLAPSAHLGDNPDLVVRLLHGENDARVDASASQQFVSALSAAGYDAGLTMFPEGHKVPHDLTLAALAALSGL